METGADHFAKVAIAVKLNEDDEADGHGVDEYGRAGLSILEEERSGSEWKKNALERTHRNQFKESCTQFDCGTGRNGENQRTGDRRESLEDSANEISFQ